jgi:predicted nicotinamide N-methyase
MASPHRSFVLRHTQLQRVPSLEEVRLHLAEEVLPLWHDVQVETGDDDSPPPYWAFAWGGGLAVGRYLRDHPEAVAGKRVFDFAAGSGICAIAALTAGAAEAIASDIDPFACAAMELNARALGAAGKHMHITSRDVLDDDPPDVDVILAGDCWYAEALAVRVRPWLLRAHAAGIEILAGDPGRRYTPTDDFVEVGSYMVRTTTELEDQDRKQAWVYRLKPGLTA